eukprot:CAMPEP_0117035488 /NCGR_PEP_ID=MMETSP0472-20121206/25196_1 /TAXON_ID=693140 ORGANISM="Tiarina fusus, Strain LIS" /NCGR_SAMPLE_ID=MMETSP0472 /ASSEMBLY_ACC=CAM_ASM_000603 /LENGTH=91 /DNA_ID=CAMNT_0004744963 /DNA_START=6 /DNA_END=281 /DNA_ORIENTATION=+
MPYLANGQVVDRRSPLSAPAMQDYFWGAINFVFAFFHTFFIPEAGEALKSGTYGEQFGPSGGSGGGPSRRRPLGGVSHERPEDAPMPMGGG